MACCLLSAKIPRFHGSALTLLPVVALSSQLLVSLVSGIHGPKAKFLFDLPLGFCEFFPEFTVFFILLHHRLLLLPLSDSRYSEPLILMLDGPFPPTASYVLFIRTGITQNGYEHGKSERCSLFPLQVLRVLVRSQILCVAYFSPFVCGLFIPSSLMCRLHEEARSPRSRCLCPSSSHAAPLHPRLLDRVTSLPGLHPLHTARACPVACSLFCAPSSASSGMLLHKRTHFCISCI